MNDERIPILDLNYEQLQRLLISWGEPSYRATQIWEWLYRSLVTEYDRMSNLPKSLRERLKQRTRIQLLSPIDARTTPDGLTRKVLFSLRDGNTIEAVLMSYERRRTVCISTQVGCAIGCPFCATGASGFIRNLSPGEIIEQVLFFARELAASGQRLTNIVIMGMGEPLHNYAATWQAIRTLTDERGFGISPRRITLSTAGVVPGIRRMSHEGLPVGLAISLHAPDDALRDELVPLNKAFPLHELMRACREYARITGRRVTFEYALIHKINDWPAQAKALAKITRGMPRLINLIPLNPTAECPYRPSKRRRMRAFQRELERYGVRNTIRLSRGVSIQAGCGQLRARSPGEISHVPQPTFRQRT